MAANQVPEDAAREIETYANVPGFAAVYLPLAGNYPLWGDRMYEPIFVAAESADLPVVFHRGGEREGLAASACTKVDNLLARLCASEQRGELRALVLDLDLAF